MQKPLSGLPTFSKEAFLARIHPWDRLQATPGADRIVIEWGIGQGPRVIVYPAVHRELGFNLLAEGIAPANDERWADFLEESYLPAVVAAIEGAGRRAQVICADQRPIQTMRQRRRAQQEFARGRTGGAH